MDSEKILLKILQNEFDIEMMKELIFHAGETDKEIISQAEKNMRLHLETEIEREILGGKESIHLLKKK